MRLAVRARSTGLASSDVDAALDQRRAVVSWLNRGTLHLVLAEDLPWLHALTTPQLRAASRRRLQQEGVSPEQAERGVAVVRRALEDGPHTRDDLRPLLQAAGVPVEGQALVHVLLAATLDGVCVRGPFLGSQQAFVLRRDWLGPPPEVDRDAALGELARRYLVGHGPASAADLARWAGVPLGSARRGLQQLRLVEHEDGLVDLPDRPEPAPLPPPRLLGPFEPLLLGWTSRDDVVGEHRSLVTVNGIFKPFALVGGRAVATWSHAGGRVAVEPLEPCQDRLDDQAADVVRFLTS